MKSIILIGSGAREHAIARAIKRSSQPSFLHCLASHQNPGLLQVADQLTVMDPANQNAVLEASQNASFAIIGPEAPLAMGLADTLNARGIPVIGPTRSLARIESSKHFCRDLLQQFQLPVSPQWSRIQSLTELEAAAEILNYSFVIKADGLMGGKGVFVSDDHFQTLEQAKAIAEKLLAAQGSFLVEEKLVGEEFSLLSFSDGQTLRHMPLVQDHKRAYEDDKGPNTGGMGSYTFPDHSLPFLPSQAHLDAQQSNEQVVRALQESCGEPYKGILYGGYMMTASGVKVIEFNARFGDPEAMNVLGLLDTDFIDICEAICSGTLNEIDVRFKPMASVCEYIVPNGYPDQPTTGVPVTYDSGHDQLYSASVGAMQGQNILLGSRAVACLAIAPDITQAKAACDALAAQVQGPVFYRKDIASESLIQKRIQHIHEIMACQT